jgi:hypothetical protein
VIGMFTGVTMANPLMYYKLLLILEGSLPV